MAGLKYTHIAEKGMKELGSNASKAITASAKGMWRVAVNATPRATGTAQEGWKLSTNRRSSYVPVRRKKAKPRVPAFSFRVTKDKRIYFWNNVPYISFLANGEGAGARVPHNMMRKAKDFFKSDVKRRLDNIK